MIYSVETLKASLLLRGTDVEVVPIVSVVSGDLPEPWRKEWKWAAIDIETSGLDARKHMIGAIQVANHSSVWVLRPPFRNPENLRELVRSQDVLKIFHHALFDLRFLRRSLGLTAHYVACTKIAAKIVEPGLSSSLAPLLKRHFSLDIDKSLQTSDWTIGELSGDQVLYAANDTVYLRRLLGRILEIAPPDALNLILRSFEYVPSRVELDLMEIGDVFTH